MWTGKRACASIVRTLLIIAVPQLAAACDGEARRTRSDTEIRDSAGVTVVHSSTRGRLGESVLQLREIQRIGGREGQEPFLFFEITDIAVDENGSYFIGNNGSGTVRVFDSEGGFVREFGGKGEGPSEVSMVNRVWLEGDSVIVVDWQRGGKTVVFTKQGQFVESWPFFRGEGSRVEPAAHLPQGWVGGMAAQGRSATGYAQGERVEWHWDLYLMHPGSESIGELLFKLPPRISYGIGQGTETVPPLFRRASSHGFDGAGNLYVSSDSTYQVDVFDHRARLMRRITRDFDPVPITSEDVETVRKVQVARSDSMLARWQVPDETIERQRKFNALLHETRFSLSRPAYLPPLGRLIVAENGAFWIQRTDGVTPVDFMLNPPPVPGFSRVPDRAIQWDLFDPAGVFLGTAEVPARFKPLSVTERTVTGVLMDDLDVEYVATFGIVTES